MKTLFEQTKLDSQSQETVWRIVNPRRMDKFDKKMFILAMHFLYKKKQGTDLPPQIPEETHMSIDGESYFKNAQIRMQQ